MGYFIAPDGGYPRHAADVQREHPDFVEGVSELPAGWVEVEPGEVPVVADGQMWSEVAPKQVDGVWVRQFVVFDAPAE